MAIKLGKGTTVSADISGSSTPISQVESVTLPEVSTDVEEFEGLADDDAFPTKVPTRNTYGDITVRVAYDPTLHSALDSAAKDIRDPGSTFTVTISSCGSFECVGVVAGEVTMEKKGLLKREYRFIVQGPSGGK